MTLSRPAASSACTHGDDEWCDECFVPTEHAAILYQLDAEADPTSARLARTFSTDRTAARSVAERLVQSEPPALCRNGRHDHTYRQGGSCDRPKAAPHVVHSIVGDAVIAGAAVLCVGLAAGYSAVDWLLHDGRLHAYAARQRIADAWARTVDY